MSALYEYSAYIGLSVTAGNREGAVDALRRSGLVVGGLVGEALIEEIEVEDGPAEEEEDE